MDLNTVLRQFATPVAFVALCTLVPAEAVPGEGISVAVFDREGQPVPDVAVYLTNAEGANSHALAGTSAVMDQIDQRFVPHVLVVQTGTSVEFPNSDTIAHHVYSFSHPNHFTLPIYKGHAHPPVSFDESGLVVLGCNIHDHMLAYILVVDTPVFEKTGEDGAATLVGQPGPGAKVSIWSPRIRDDQEKLSVPIDASGNGTEVVFRLQKALRAPHHEQSGVLSWTEY